MQRERSTSEIEEQDQGPQPSAHEIRQKLEDSLQELFKRDITLLIDDVSERAIAHKLAEYLQLRFPLYHVDCEYNRNYQAGKRSPKFIRTLNSAASEINIQEHKKAINNEDAQKTPDVDLKFVSTFPDIIVHMRRSNDWNILVIEIKKSNSKISEDFDHLKLQAFTSDEDGNHYNFKCGAFVKIFVGTESHSTPKIEKWFGESAD